MHHGIRESVPETPPGRAPVVDQLLDAARAFTLAELRAATARLRVVDGLQLSIWTEEATELDVVRRYCGAWLRAGERSGRVLNDRTADWRQTALELAQNLYESRSLRPELRQRVESMIGRSEASHAPTILRWWRWMRQRWRIAARTV